MGRRSLMKVRMNLVVRSPKATRKIMNKKVMVMQLNVKFAELSKCLIMVKM